MIGYKRAIYKQGLGEVRQNAILNLKIKLYEPSTISIQYQ